MFLLPHLRHGAGSTASRSLRHTTSLPKRLDCHVPVARTLSTSSITVRHVLQAFTLSGSSLFRPSIHKQRGFDRQVPNHTRCVSLEAPREPIAGSEPGINIKNEDAWPQWRKKVQSQITAVDFSKDRIEKYELNNSTLGDFLAKSREDWVTCRWINGKRSPSRARRKGGANPISLLCSEWPQLGCCSIVGREAEVAQSGHRGSFAHKESH